MLRVNPQVKALIDPIARAMTEITWAEKTYPVYGQRNETKEVTAWKKRCVHYIYEGQELVLNLSKNSEGKLVCDSCQREVNTTFDETAWKTLAAAIPVLNQLVVFGMVNGLDAAPLQAIINMKEQMPAVITICKELCEFVKKENMNGDPANNIGVAYQGTQFRGITGMK